MSALPVGFLDRPFAHRGLHGLGAPENSVEAIQAAIEAGYGIEIDVQLSADGVAIVFHDYELRRLTGIEGWMRKTASSEVSDLTLLGGSSAPPMLSDALSLIAGRVPLLVEIKDQDGRLGREIGPLEKAVAAALGEYAGPVAVMSFNPHSMAEMARLAPEVPRGLVTDPFEAHDWLLVPAARRQELAEIPDAARVGASFVSHNRAHLSAAAVAKAKAAGLAICCWTVRSEAEAREARVVADQITFEGYRA
ncbi:MAG: glycerophosphodiester phosphodiesterase family protein [Pseudomonadota bacterium]